MTLVVNLFGAPGSGKSTTAAHVFALLKHKGINCELVQEYAKELYWQNKLIGTMQRDIFEEQFHRTNRLLGKVDVIITDSPCELSYIYAMESGVSKEIASEYLKDSGMSYLKSKHRRYNVGIHRSNSYNPKGREQSESESNALACKILEATELEITDHIYGNLAGVYDLLDYIMEKLK